MAEDVCGTNGAHQKILLYNCLAYCLLKQYTVFFSFCGENKEGKSVSKQAGFGGLEKFEMPHVALILRMETDRITGSFRNSLYCVSRS